MNKSKNFLDKYTLTPDQFYKLDSQQISKSKERFVITLDIIVIIFGMLLLTLGNLILLEFIIIFYYSIIKYIGTPKVTDVKKYKQVKLVSNNNETLDVRYVDKKCLNLIQPKLINNSYHLTLEQFEYMEFLTEFEDSTDWKTYKMITNQNVDKQKEIYNYTYGPKSNLQKVFNKSQEHKLADHSKVIVELQNAITKYERPDFSEFKSLTNKVKLEFCMGKKVLSYTSTVLAIMLLLIPSSSIFIQPVVAALIILTLDNIAQIKLGYSLILSTFTNTYEKEDLYTTYSNKETYYISKDEAEISEYIGIGWSMTPDEYTYIQYVVKLTNSLDLNSELSYTDKHLIYRYMFGSNSTFKKQFDQDLLGEKVKNYHTLESALKRQNELADKFLSYRDEYDT